jgi:peptidoglycan hydrolase-like protein with peptidoglycan-binding domain
VSDQEQPVEDDTLQDQDTPQDQPDEPVKKGSIYDDVGVDEPGKPGSPAWPEDWRAQMAGGDDKLAKRLERYSTPDAVGKALLSAQQRISSGEYKRGLPQDATEEQVKEWREEQGLPADPTGYELPVIMDGSYDDLDEFGKETFSEFQKMFHENNIHPNVADKLISQVNAVAEKQLEAQAMQDAQQMEAIEDDLRSTWGSQFRQNLALNESHFKEYYGDEWNNILMARMPDGTILANHPGFNKAHNQMARELGGTALETGETFSNSGGSARIKEIENIMKTDLGKYRREGLDVEYAELLAAQQRRGG